jgi:hypothetical protein
MMTDLEKLLNDMRDAAHDPRLDGMEGAVLAGMAVRREHVQARRSLAVTGVLALGIGLAASLASPQGARAEGMSLNAVPASAPSSLLLGAR